MKFNGEEVLCWSLNNYLGLANHPEIRRVDGEASVKWGLAYPMGSRLMTGHTDLHEELERRLAAFEKKEAAFLFNFQGILSAIDSLVGRNDVIVYDAEDHACLLDGIRLHIGSKYKIFCSVVIYSVIPPGMVIFRIIPTAAHSMEDVERTLTAFRDIKERLDRGEFDKEMPNMAIFK